MYKPDFMMRVGLHHENEPEDQQLLITLLLAKKEIQVSLEFFMPRRYMPVPGEQALPCLGSDTVYKIQLLRL